MAEAYIRVYAVYRSKDDCPFPDFDSGFWTEKAAKVRVAKKNAEIILNSAVAKLKKRNWVGYNLSFLAHKSLSFSDYYSSVSIRMLGILYRDNIDDVEEERFYYKPLKIHNFLKNGTTIDEMKQDGLL